MYRDISFLCPETTHRFVLKSVSGDELIHPRTGNAVGGSDLTRAAALNNKQQ